MKRVFYIISLFVGNQLTAQSVDSTAIMFESSYTCDIGRNLRGGMQKGNFYLGMINLSANGQILPSTSFYVQLQNTHGRSPSFSLTGDLEVFSNIDNGDYTYLYMAWVRQKLGDFSATIGVHDLNSEFINTELGALFLNSSFGIQPSASLNMPVSIFPKNALGLVLNYRFSDNFNLLTAVYDGDPGSLENDRYNLDYTIDLKEQGLLSAAEIQFYQNKNCVKAGLFHHSGKFVNFSDSSEVRGNLSTYLITDLYLNDNLGLFSQLGYASPAININPFYAGIGLNIFGLGKRTDDVLGFAATYTSISRKLRSIDPVMNRTFETAIELTYLLSVNNNITAQPDIQYIINPGATSALQNALIGFIRININL